MNERMNRSVCLFFVKFLENHNDLMHFIATNYRERVHLIKILNALLKHKKKKKKKKREREIETILLVALSDNLWFI